MKVSQKVNMAGMHIVPAFRRLRQGCHVLGYPELHSELLSQNIIQNSLPRHNYKNEQLFLKTYKCHSCFKLSCGINLYFIETEPERSSYLLLRQHLSAVLSDMQVLFIPPSAALSSLPSLHLSLFFNYLYVYGCFTCMCVRAPRMCLASTVVGRGHRIPENWSYEDC